MEKKNKGVLERSEMDKKMMDSKDTIDPIKCLEKKAEQYDKIKDGNSGLLKMGTEKFLVDFDRIATEKFHKEQSFKSEKSQFYDLLKKETLERDQKSIQDRQGTFTELGEHFQNLERERTLWEREALEHIDEELEEHDSLKKRFYVRQRYDKTLTKEEKDKLDIVRNESKTEKSRISDIKKLRQEANRQREEKLKKLKVV